MKLEVLGGKLLERIINDAAANLHPSLPDQATAMLSDPESLALQDTFQAVPLGFQTSPFLSPLAMFGNLAMDKALLHIQVPHAQGVGFDEVAAGFHFFAHQGGEDAVGGDGVFDLHP